MLGVILNSSSRPFCLLLTTSSGGHYFSPPFGVVKWRNEFPKMPNTAELVSDGGRVRSFGFNLECSLNRGDPWTVSSSGGLTQSYLHSAPNAH